MPTRELLPQFLRDWEQLTPEQQRAFRTAVAKFVDDLRARRGFRPGLRVKGVRSIAGAYELTWAPDGRATFSYGRSVVEGEPHIIWRRIGTHEILRES
jgi:hypothetical protein